jgi:hypothetical protein
MATIRSIGTAPDLASRYLDDQLTPQERDAFEAKLISDPEVVQELERVARLKVGLAKLAESGELEALVHRPASETRRPAWAWAASIALVILAVGLWRTETDVTRAPMLAASLKALPVAASIASGSIERYTMLRTRSVDYDAIVIARPTAPIAELRILPGDTAHGPSFRATVYRLTADSEKAVARAEGLVADDSGYLTAYLDTSKLSPGPYAFVIESSIPDDGSPIRERFLIKVARAADAGR